MAIRKAPGKSYAKGGPASLRNKKADLRQSKISSLSRPQREHHSEARLDETDELANASPQIDPQTLVEIDDHSGTEGRSAVTFKNVELSSDLDEGDSRQTFSKRQAEATASQNHEVASRPVQKKRKRKAYLQQSKIQFTSSGSRYMTTDPLDSEEESFKGTQLERRAVKKPSVTGGHVASKAAKSIQINSETELESNLESDEALARPIATPGRKKQRVVEKESDDEDLVTPMRRRKRFMPVSSMTKDAGRKTEQVHKHEGRNQEIASDARDLDHRLIKTTKHRRGNVQKSAFRSNLDKLRRKKAGLPSESEQEESDSESEGSSTVRPATPDNWIVEDDVDRQQVLDDLPEEFQQPRQPLEQFKIAVQWEILDLLMPQGGLAPDRYFKPAIDWLRERTFGKSQAAISSIWRRTFVRALQRGPILNAIETGNLGYFCDACGRTSRVATYVAKFEGSRYDHLTLEDLDSDASSSEDDLDVDDDAASDPEVERERKERILRSEWNLGSNCYDRTVATHELYHLRKHLREDIHDKLADLDLFSASKIYERSTLRKSERIEFANQITEQLDLARFQQRLWSRYKQTIEKHEAYIVDPNSGRRKSRYVIS